MKEAWLEWPTQWLIHGQWWSIFLIHLGEKNLYNVDVLCQHVEIEIVVDSIGLLACIVIMYIEFPGLPLRK